MNWFSVVTDDGLTCLINADKITALANNEEDTFIMMDAGTIFQVKETIPELRAKIDGHPVREKKSTQFASPINLDLMRKTIEDE